MCIRDRFEPIGKYFYGINDCMEEFNYAKIGARIQLQRNNFAHGNLDQEFEEITILDLIYLEKIVYILQLSRYEIDNDTIINQIKRLFGMNFWVVLEFIRRWQHLGNKKSVS